MLKPKIAILLDEFSHETYIPKEDLFKALEKAFVTVAKNKYGYSRNIKVSLNRVTITPTFYHGLEVVENNPNIDQISYAEAKALDENIELGKVFLRKLPDIELNREYMQTIQNIFVQEIENIKLERQYEEFISRVGDIFQVTIKNIVKNFHGGSTTIASVSNQNEGVLKTIPGESLHVKEKVYAQLIDVVKPAVKAKFQENKLVFTRTSDDFVAKLLEKHVNEIREKTIEIVALARIPGFKTKIAVRTTEIGKYGRIDPIYPCIGPNGVVVKEIIKELGGEKVDIFRWSEDTKELIINALYPIAPFNINIMNHMIEVIVADSFIGQALGSQGKNVRLISNIVGKRVAVFTQDQAQANKERAEKNILNLKEILSLDDFTARLLVIHGYATLLDIINANDYIYDLGIQSEKIDNLILDAKYTYALSIFEEFGISQSLFDILQGINVNELLKCIKIAENKILNVKDFCKLTVEDFRKIVYDTYLTDEEIEDLLSAADNASDEDL